MQFFICPFFESVACILHHLGFLDGCQLALFRFYWLSLLSTQTRAKGCRRVGEPLRK